MTIASTAAQLKLNVTNINSVLVKGNKSMTRLKAFKAKTIFNMEQDELRKKEEDSLEAVKPKKKKITADNSPIKSKGGILNKLMTFAGIILGGVLINALPAILKKLKDIFTSVFNFLKPIGKFVMNLINFISGDSMDMSKYDAQKATVDDQFDKLKTASDDLNSEIKPVSEIESLLGDPSELDEEGEIKGGEEVVQENEVSETNLSPEIQSSIDAASLNQQSSDNIQETVVDAMRDNPQVEKKRRGGKIKTGKGFAEDSVPALLSPGEFVITRKIAERIGYGRLDNIINLKPSGSTHLTPKKPNDISMLNKGKRKGRTTIVMQTQVVEKIVPVPV